MHQAVHASRFMHMDGVMQTATLTPLNKNIPNVIFRRLCDKTGLKRYSDDKKKLYVNKIHLSICNAIVKLLNDIKVLTDTNLIK